MDIISWDSYPYLATLLTILRYSGGGYCTLRVLRSSTMKGQAQLSLAGVSSLHLGEGIFLRAAHPTLVARASHTVHTC